MFKIVCIIFILLKVVDSKIYRAKTNNKKNQTVEHLVASGDEGPGPAFYGYEEKKKMREYEEKEKKKTKKNSWKTIRKEETTDIIKAFGKILKLDSYLKDHLENLVKNGTYILPLLDSIYKTVKSNSKSETENFKTGLIF